MSTIIDPLGEIGADYLKPIKKFGKLQSDSGSGVVGHWQKPSASYLEEKGWELGGDAVTYNYKGGESVVNDILSRFPAEPKQTGGNGVQVTLSQDGEPLGNISVTVLQVKMKPRGETPKEEADFGSDGEGSTDYDLWSMKKDKQLTNDKWKIEWEDTKNWLPFAYYGKQLIDPWTLAAYKLLVDGDHFLGDVITMSDGTGEKTQELRKFEQTSTHSDIQGWDISQINPISRNSVAYNRLMQGRVLVLTHSWSE